jgi:hypothetical protein
MCMFLYIQCALSTELLSRGAFSCLYAETYICISQAALEKFEGALETALQAEVSWCEEVFPDGAHFAVGVYWRFSTVYYLCSCT